VGGTGTGKSTLASYLLTQRKYVIVLKSKPDEVTYDMPTKRTANSIESVDRMVLSPTGNQRSHFAYAYDRVWRQGGWTIYVDELFYHTEKLHLGTAVDNLLTQGRSKHISVMIGMQRPVRVTRFALSECSHIISFSLEGRDNKTIRDVTNDEMYEKTSQLQRFQFAWYSRPDRRVWVGRLQDLIHPD